MSQYIGITLGPIMDTMSQTSTPAGLWAASYLFSYLAHEIRKNIGKEGLIQDDLKYDDKNDDKNVENWYSKGVGLYHDRIIYEADGEHTLRQAYDAVNNAVENIVQGFENAIQFDEEKEKIREFFREYFNIHIISVDVKEGENFLIRVNDVLDVAELEKNFPSKVVRNPILFLFDGSRTDTGTKGDQIKKNEQIKNSFLVRQKEKTNKYDWVLSNDTEYGIKDLPTIAKAEETYLIPQKEGKDKVYFKPSKYYAVIRADGDNMGTTIKETISKEEDYIDFSKKCFKYGCKTAEIVLKYGGIPIYVGGDDLLCIAPLMQKFDDGKAHTFLEMIQDIRQAFKNEFSGAPDLSFGVQIQYVKAPLYEALQDSGRLLFGTAKANKPGAFAINLRKHSGQSAEVVIKNIGDENGGAVILKQLNELIEKHVNDKEATLKSVGKHISDFETLLNEGAKQGDFGIERFFVNMFDHDVKEEDRNYIEKITELAKTLNEKTDGGELAETMGRYIRLIKFFSEKVDKEEA